ncbi:MAG: M23 family metallopeptidase [Lachnospiraceae bacterium]
MKYKTIVFGIMFEFLILGLTKSTIAEEINMNEINRLNVQIESENQITARIRTVDDFNELNCIYVFSDTSHHIKISSGYKVAGREDHKGIDIISNSAYYPIDGASINQIYGGTVTVSKKVVYDSAGNVTNDNGGAGNYVVVQLNAVYSGTNQNIKVRYLHMKNSPTWVAGEAISQGDTVGYVGTTGGSTGPHLHIDMNPYNSDVPSLNQTVNPLRFFSNVSFEF